MSKCHTSYYCSLLLQLAEIEALIVISSRLVNCKGESSHASHASMYAIMHTVPAIDKDEGRRYFLLYCGQLLASTGHERQQTSQHTGMQYARSTELSETKRSCLRKIAVQKAVVALSLWPSLHHHIRHIRGTASLTSSCHVQDPFPLQESRRQ